MRLHSHVTPCTVLWVSSPISTSSAVLPCASLTSSQYSPPQFTMYTALFKVPTLGSTHFQHIAHCTRKHEHTRTRAHCTLHTRRHPPCASSAPGFAFPSSNLNSLCLRAKTIVKHVLLKRWMSHCLHLWNLHLSAAYIRQDSHRLHHFQTHLSAGASSFATAIHEKQKVLAI